MSTERRLAHGMIPSPSRKMSSSSAESENRVYSSIANQFQIGPKKGSNQPKPKSNIFKKKDIVLSKLEVNQVCTLVFAKYYLYFQQFLSQQCHLISGEEVFGTAPLH